MRRAICGQCARESNLEYSFAGVSDQGIYRGARCPYCNASPLYEVRLESEPKPRPAAVYQQLRIGAAPIDLGD